MGLSPASPVPYAFPLLLLLLLLLLRGCMLMQLVLQQHLNVLRRRRRPLGWLLRGKDAVGIERSQLLLGPLQNPEEVDIQFTVCLVRVVSLL